MKTVFSELQENKIIRAFNPEIAAEAFPGMFFSYFNSREFLVSKKWKAVKTNMVIEDFVDIFIRGTAR